MFIFIQCDRASERQLRHWLAIVRCMGNYKYGMLVAQRRAIVTYSDGAPCGILKLGFVCSPGVQLNHYLLKKTLPHAYRSNIYDDLAIREEMIRRLKSDKVIGIATIEIDKNELRDILDSIDCMIEKRKRTLLENLPADDADRQKVENYEALKESIMKVLEFI